MNHPILEDFFREHGTDPVLAGHIRKAIGAFMAREPGWELRRAAVSELTGHVQVHFRRYLAEGEDATMKGTDKDGRPVAVEIFSFRE